MNRLTLIMALLIGTQNVVSWCQETDPRVQQVQTDMKKIGLAIEQLYKDKGVLPVDLNDDDYPEGIQRIQTVFEGVGMPVNEIRTIRDVLLPLVHFGYLDAIPADPFIPANATPEWNTYVYTDEEDAIPDNDSQVPFLSRRVGVPTSQNYYLLSPGPNGEIETNWEDNIILTRYQLYMQTPLLEDVLERQQIGFQKLSQAIQKLYQEKGVYLVDFWDDDTYIGYDRINKVFDGSGSQEQAKRTMEDILRPLIHFGYLDEIPIDPVIMPYPYLAKELDKPELYQFYLFYADNDPEIPGVDAGVPYLDSPLIEGDWILIGNSPDSSSWDPKFSTTPVILRGNNLLTSVLNWNCYSSD